MDGWPLVLLFILILVNAFFSMSEIAIISLNDTKLKKLAEEGHSGAKKVLTAAAMTYIAAFLVSLAQLLRLLAIANRRR